MIGFFALGVAAGGCSTSKEGDSSGASSPDQKNQRGGEATAAAKKRPATAAEVLAAMAAAYKNAASYADRGTLRLVAEVGGQKIDQTVGFAVTLVRPDKLRAEVYQATLVIDGRQLRAVLSNLPDQVLVKKAPPELTLKAVYSDPFLASIMTGGIAGGAPQLLLLLEQDPLEPLLRDAEQPVLLEPGEIEGRKCYRVQLKWPYGTAVFWIDQQTYVLQRLILPTDGAREILARLGSVENLSLVADFADARFNGQVDAQAFQFEAPPGAEVVQFLIPPHPAQLLGKKVPAFTFVDLENKLVTPQSLGGKITVLDFWATWCGPCRQSLPNLEKVYQHYKDNEKIAFLAVSVDQPQTENKVLGDTFSQLGVHVPIVRDQEQSMGRLFRVPGIPTTFIVDAQGVVQDFEIGGNPALPAVLPQKLEKLLAGEDIYQKPLEEYQNQLKKEQQRLESIAEAEASGRPISEEQEIPRAQVAARSEPQKLRLSPLWKCTELQAPGNILPFVQAGGSARLLVIENWNSVAEVALDGKLIARHPLGLDQREIVTALRAAAGADGKQYFAAFASGQQRLHVFDGNWKKLFSFPEDALQNPHDGIADVEFADLDGNGTPELYVGYWGVVGVQAVSLEGKRVAANRSIANVLRLAVGGPLPQGRRHLFCINDRGSLTAMDEKLQPQGAVTVPDRSLQWIVAAELGGDGRLYWCGLVAPQLGDNVALGLNLDGEELWNYTLPVGVPPQPIERIIPGRLSASPPGQWLLPGPDGSIHVIAADGTLIDRFNYGVPLHGLATAKVDGRPALIVASEKGLEAWRVE
jgi:thiol-disulfide isomerase/thioredoxin